MQRRQNIIEKAAAYKMRKNLEVPATFKSKSFNNESVDALEAYASAVDLKIGMSDEDRSNIISDIIRSESENCLEFASQHPDISLPDDIDDAFYDESGVCTPENCRSDSNRPGGTAGSVGSLEPAPKQGLYSLSHPFKIP